MKTILVSINPETDLPYLDIAIVQEMIRYHVHNYIPTLLKHYEMEDIVQTVLTQMSASEYKPDKSAPKTFAIKIIQTRTLTMQLKFHRQKHSKDVIDNDGKKIKHDKNGKNLTVPIIASSENVLIEQSGEILRITELHTDSVTPEDYIIAQELLKHLLTLPVDDRHQWLKEQGYGSWFRAIGVSRHGKNWDIHNEWDTLLGRRK